MQGQFDEQAVAGTCPHLLSLDGTPAANHAHLFYAPIITLSRLSHAAIRDGTPPPPPHTRPAPCHSPACSWCPGRTRRTAQHAAGRCWQMQLSKEGGEVGSSIPEHIQITERGGVGGSSAWQNTDRCVQEHHQC
jgi:hypothetical protein